MIDVVHEINAVRRGVPASRSVMSMCAGRRFRRDPVGPSSNAAVE
jgi:hypothetical protein